MAEAPKRRRPVWKILAVIAGVLIALVGSAALWIRSAADRKFTAMEDRIRALESEAHVAEKARRAGTSPGDAWEDYLLALTEAGKLKEPEKLIGLFNGTLNGDQGFGEAALAAHGSAIDDLLRGARRASSTPPATFPDLRAWETVVLLAVLRARKLPPVEAIEIHLAVCQFAQDLEACGSWDSPGLGTGALEKALEELQTPLQSPSFTMPASADLEARLALVEESLTRPERLRQGRLRLVGMMQTSVDFSTAVQNTGAIRSLLCWRYGFSVRLMSARTFESWDHWLGRAQEADRFAWPQAQQEFKRLRQEIDHTVFEGHHQDLTSPFLEDGSAGRTLRAHLRLLRAAVHYRRTGEVLELDDPFGTKLLHREGGGRLRVWSVGIDGVDQHGKGNWDSRVIEDIVLEVPR